MKQHFFSLRLLATLCCLFIAICAAIVYALRPNSDAASAIRDAVANYQPNTFELRVVADTATPHTVKAVVARSEATVHLTSTTIMTSADIEEVRLERNHAGLPCINLIAKNTSVKKLVHWNKFHRGKRIAILINGLPHLVAPISIQSGKHYRIGAGLDSDELTDLIRLMEHDGKSSAR